MLCRPMLVPVVLVLALAGCSSQDAGNDGVVPETTASTITNSTVPPTFPEEGEPWDLVVITNSIGEGVAEPYAALASEALGHPVRPHSGVVDFVDATQVLAHLQDTAYPPMSELVRNAEIVLIYGEPEQGDFWDSCGLTPVKDEDPPSSVHTAADWQQYRTELEAVFSEVRMLRGDLPTVLLTIDMPLGMVNRWQPDTLEACIAGWETLNEVHRTAAEAHDVVMVSLFDAFNGPNHDEDPYAKGFIVGDRVHTSQAGVALIAESLAQAGFNPTDSP